MRTTPATVVHALASLPLLWVAWFYLYVLRLRFDRGSWPLSSGYDRTGGKYLLHGLSIYLGVVVVPLLAATAVGFIIRRKSKDPHFRWWLAGGLLTLSFGSYLGVMYLDPGDYWHWFRRLDFFID